MQWLEDQMRLIDVAALDLEGKTRHGGDAEALDLGGDETKKGY